MFVDNPTRSNSTSVTSALDQPDITTIRSTLTTYKTITVIRSSSRPLTPTSPAPATITAYLSTTIPSELVAHPTKTSEEPTYTIQTSTNAALTSPPSSESYHHIFPTFSPSSINGTATGIFYSASLANSSLVQPTPFFPNTTSSRPHYSIPSLEVVNGAGMLCEKATATVIGAIVMILALLA